MGDYGLETDFYWTYSVQAKALQTGTLILDPFRGLVYPIILALFGFVFEMFKAGIIINVLCASVSLYLIYIIIDKHNCDKNYDKNCDKNCDRMSQSVALGTMCLVLSNQWFVKYTYSVGTDMLFLVFFLTVIYYILTEKWILAGIFTALAYNTRYAGVSLVVAGIILLILKYKRKEN